MQSPTAVGFSKPVAMKCFQSATDIDPCETLAQEGKQQSLVSTSPKRGNRSEISTTFIHREIDTITLGPIWQTASVSDALEANFFPVHICMAWRLNLITVDSLGNDSLECGYSASTADARVWRLPARDFDSFPAFDLCQKAASKERYHLYHSVTRSGNRFRWN